MAPHKVERKSPQVKLLALWRSKLVPPHEDKIVPSKSPDPKVVPTHASNADHTSSFPPL